MRSRADIHTHTHDAHKELSSIDWHHSLSPPDVVRRARSPARGGCYRNNGLWCCQSASSFTLLDSLQTLCLGAASPSPPLSPRMCWKLSLTSRNIDQCRQNRTNLTNPQRKSVHYRHVNHGLDEPEGVVLGKGSSGGFLSLLFDLFCVCRGAFAIKSVISG